MGVQIQSNNFEKYSLVALLVLTLLVFCRVGTFDFMNLDDPRHLDSNPYFQPTPLSHLEGVWKNPYLLYMPMTYTVWGILASVSPSQSQEHFQYAPMLFHLANLFFHLCSVALLFFILRRYFSPSLAAIGASLFAFHPTQVEPVVWVSGLKDTLSGVFFLGALFLVLQFRQKKWVYFYVASLVSFLLALLSKPNVIIFPFVVFALVYWMEKLSWKPALLLSLPHLFLALPFAWITSQLQADSTLQFTPVAFYLRPLVALDTLGFYFVKLLWPFNLAIDYGRTPEVALAGPFLYTAVGVIVLSLLGYAALKHPLLRAGVVIFLVSLFPVLGFKAFSFQTTSSVADRYLYLPMIGISFLIAAVIVSVIARSAATKQFPRIATALATLLLLLAARSFHQAEYWKNTPTMFTHNLEVHPESWLIHNNFGSYLEKEYRFDEALAHYEKAGQLKNMNIFHNNRGNVYLTLKKYPEAAAAFRRALEINPLSSPDNAGLGVALTQMGKTREADAAFRRASQLNPSIPKETWQNLAKQN